MTVKDIGYTDKAIFELKQVGVKHSTYAPKIIYMSLGLPVNILHRVFGFFIRARRSKSRVYFWDEVGVQKFRYGYAFLNYVE
jgi:hypothetical protein